MSLRHTAQAKKIYKSTLWKKTRSAYIATQHGLCERCYGIGKIVHHKEHLSLDNINDPHIVYGFDNLELLCQDCHNKEHFGGSDHNKGVFFDDDGNIIVDDEIRLR